MQQFELSSSNQMLGIAPNESKICAFGQFQSFMPVLIAVHSPSSI